MTTPTVTELHDFDVLAELAHRGLLRFAPMRNVRTVEWSRRKGATFITIGMEGNLVHEFESGKLRGGFVLVDSEDFCCVRVEMEEALRG